MSQRPSPLSYIQFGALTAQEWLSSQLKSIDHITEVVRRSMGRPTTRLLAPLPMGLFCPVCGQTNKLCPGHWGVIKLEEPCYNPEYIDYVLGIFKCVCINCCAPLIPESAAGGILGLSRSARFKAYKKRAETLKQCPACQELIASLASDHQLKCLRKRKEENIDTITGQKPLQF